MFQLCNLHYITDAPQVTVLSTTVATWEGETVELSCTADANPSQTTAIWYHNDVALSLETDELYAQYVKGNTHILEIKSITRQEPFLFELRHPLELTHPPVF